MYLAVVKQFPDCMNTLEATAGAIENLTACKWKVNLFYKCLCPCINVNI